MPQQISSKADQRPTTSESKLQPPTTNEAGFQSPKNLWFRFLPPLTIESRSQPPKNGESGFEPPEISESRSQFPKPSEPVFTTFIFDPPLTDEELKEAQKFIERGPGKPLEPPISDEEYEAAMRSVGLMPEPELYRAKWPSAVASPTRDGGRDMPFSPAQSIPEKRVGTSWWADKMSMKATKPLG
ncbi:hypothetical protein IFR05_010857 [Cadophora sp. M221]|nr:hypothetical protein IFR05_010857 [Cadophora sp. M221]